MMPVENYIITIGGLLLSALAWYWFNRINSGIEEFKTQCIKNKEHIARNYDRTAEHEKDLVELSRDIRLMVKGITDLNSQVATHDFRIKTVEDKIKKNGH